MTKLIDFNDKGRIFTREEVQNAVDAKQWLDERIETFFDEDYQPLFGPKYGYYESWQMETTDIISIQINTSSRGCYDFETISVPLEWLLVNGPEREQLMKAEHEKRAQAEEKKRAEREASKLAHKKEQLAKLQAEINEMEM